ncbi:MAG TPA: DUF4783 domain-containing protein [Flavipsychrobacter sp.]|nr:DUF4783 domain-containing protein [Flavipsychrobacter sp.]
MNNVLRKTVLILYCLFFFVGAKAQQAQVSPVEDIVSAMRNSNTATIAKYFDNIVPITINNTQSIYSRTQAEMVLKDFFNKNMPKDLTIINSGAPNNTSKFAIGDITTSGGKYSVYILLRAKDNVFLLQELRFNKE